jgi:hypothetical protein
VRGYLDRIFTRFLERCSEFGSIFDFLAILANRQTTHRLSSREWFRWEFDLFIDGIEKSPILIQALFVNTLDFVCSSDSQNSQNANLSFIPQHSQQREKIYHFHNGLSCKPINLMCVCSEIFD